MCVRIPQNPLKWLENDTKITKRESWNNPSSPIPSQKPSKLDSEAHRCWTLDANSFSVFWRSQQYKLLLKLKKSLELKVNKAGVHFGGTCGILHIPTFNPYSAQHTVHTFWMSWYFFFLIKRDRNSGCQIQKKRRAPFCYDIFKRKWCVTKVTVSILLWWHSEFPLFLAGTKSGQNTRSPLCEEIKYSFKSQLVKHIYSSHQTYTSIE